MNPDELADKAVDALDQADKPEEKEVAEKVESKETPEADKPEEEQGFTADDVEEVEEEEAKPAPEVAEIDPSKLDPEAKYIIENLPYITARIKDGGQVKEVQVKSWTQLPEDLEFASKRDEIAFVNALQAQENRATELQRKFQQTQQNEQAQDFERRENEAIREDIAELQKAGELPKFKVKADDPKFSEDPATKEVQKIMDYMNGRNEQYLKEYNQGRPYRHIGFSEAYSMYRRENPATNEKQKAEDKERKDVADKVAGNKGLATSKMPKSTVKPGTRVDQILDRLDQEEW